jgi:Tfp pilus assembly protein PilV
MVIMKRWQMELKKIKERKGFILVDAMVAVLILAIGLAALALLYTGGIGTLHKSSTREKAVQVAADRIEVIKGYAAKNSATLTYTNLKNFINNDLNSTTHTNVTTTTDSETYTVKGTISDKLDKLDGWLTGDDFLVPVTVEVTWNSPEPQSCKLTTYIALASNS